MVLRFPATLPFNKDILLYSGVVFHDLRIISDNGRAPNQVSHTCTLSYGKPSIARIISDFN